MFAAVRNYVAKLWRSDRKTGVMLPDSGVRDEHGMEPIENLFSSPKKPDDEDEEEESDDGDSGEAPMELTTSMFVAPFLVASVHLRP